MGFLSFIGSIVQLLIAGLVAALAGMGSMTLYIQGNIIGAVVAFLIAFVAGAYVLYLDSSDFG